MAEKLPVVYRMIRDECIAIFPTVPASLGRLACYAHIGQHFETHIHYAKSGKLAQPEEYKELHAELVRIYSPEYQLVIKKKIGYQK